MESNKLTTLIYIYFLLFHSLIFLNTSTFEKQNQNLVHVQKCTYDLLTPIASSNVRKKRRKGAQKKERKKKKALDRS